MLMWKDQKGFTLVELIVVIAIISIVSVSIVGFMVTGSKSYAASSSETNLQKEAQIAMNQISDLIIDTSKVVTYSYQADASDSEHFVIKDSEIPADPYSKRLCMYNGAKAYEVIWKNDGSNKLYYAEYGVTDGAKTGTPTEYLLSEYVTSFQADLTDLEKKRVVQLSADFEKGERKYRASNNVTIRNKVVVNNLADYEDPTIPGGTVDTITVQGPVYLAPNESYTFAKPLISGTGAPSQEVIWSFEKDGDHNSDTTIDQNGKITIGRTETHPSFRVKVTSKADNTKTGLIPVNLVRINKVTLTTDNSNFVPEQTFTVSSSVEDYNIGFDQTGKRKGLNWKIVAGESFIDDLGVTSDGRHSYRIKKDCVNGSKIRIRATSSHSVHWDYPNDSHIYGELEVMVSSVSGGKLGIGDEFTIGTDDGYQSPDFNATFERYVKIESSEANRNVWTNVGNIYEHDGYFTGTYQTSGEFAGWYKINNVDSEPKLFVPQTLNLDLDHKFTMREVATERDVYGREPRKRDMVILEEVVRRVKLGFTSTDPLAPVIDADHVDLHSYILDRTWNSKTGWHDFSAELSDVAKAVSGRRARLHYKWNGENHDFLYCTGQNDVKLEIKVDTNKVAEAGTYRYWPTMTIDNGNNSYDRPESYVEWKVDVGNIDILKKEGFLPYPTHPDFAGKLAIEEVDQAVRKEIDILFRNDKEKQKIESTHFYLLVTKDENETYTVQVFEDPNRGNRIGNYRCKASETKWTKISND